MNFFLFSSIMSRVRSSVRILLSSNMFSSVAFSYILLMRNHIKQAWECVVGSCVEPGNLIVGFKPLTLVFYFCQSFNFLIEKRKKKKREKKKALNACIWKILKVVDGWVKYFYWCGNVWLNICVKIFLQYIQIKSLSICYLLIILFLSSFDSFPSICYLVTNIILLL